MNNIRIDNFILNALEEDVGSGDITTECCIPEDSRSTAILKAKADGIICGLFIAERVFEILDRNVKFTSLKHDGDHITSGDIIAKIEGSSRAILTGERLALNILQRLSGIAKQTSDAVFQVAGTKAHITDTRKTTPCMRLLERYAVRCGGGTNHRFNLSDGALIKDNHIAAAGSITAAVAAVKKAAPHTMKIEVEISSLEQIEEAISAGADIIMLDNMSIEDMAAAVKKIDGRTICEASGNMAQRDLKTVADTGVDFISIGALTHSPHALDISLQFIE